IFLTLPVIGSAAQTITLKGVATDGNGRPLPSAHAILEPDSVSILTDTNGSFSIKTSPGLKKLTISFIGHESNTFVFRLTRDSIFNVPLYEKIQELAPVTIQDMRDRQLEIFEGNRTGTHVLTQQMVTGIPVLMGEADLIKTLQLLPGTVRGVEGSSDLFVRGGSADQNLVLLDGAPVYNTSHLFGFLSVFNPDILDHVEAMNGGFPARYGGRLSSILDIRSKSNIPDKTSVSGDIGLISSRLFVEHPVIAEKASLFLGGRRTYIDRVVKLIGEELPYFFYDLNGKLILQPRPKDHIELSYYGGEDILDHFRDRNNDGDGLLTTYESGNNSQSLYWRHKFTNLVRSDFNIIHSRYRYNIRNAFEDNTLAANSDINDYSAKFTVTRDSLPRNASLVAGAEWTAHHVSPSLINTSGIISELVQSSAAAGRVADEFAIHGEYSWSPSPSITVSSGIRQTAALVARKGYLNTEPRVSARFRINESHAVKASYARMAQYIHRVSSSAITSPTDIWYPVTDSIKPQRAHQVSLAWQYALPDKKLFASVETYFKSMRDLIGFEEGTNLFLNTEFESKLIQGRGRASGVEFFFRKDQGKFTGWVSYTLAWSWRQFDGINRGDWFRARYDRRHNGALVVQYAINERWSASCVWEFISGSRFTPVIGQYTLVAPTLTGVDVIPVYAPINSVKLSDTHRLDVGLKYKSRPGNNFQWQWFTGLYNTYNRTAPIGIMIAVDETTGALQYQQPGLFGLLPFISYGFKL
ncbi:MAG TPA: TonB-dependent receptor plug domain-containing protein, partial [Chryseosolibacter sp.]|nr:TonB-dependent receptor plug domain-containing protein [Chryseosolibacter sp.]